MGIYTRLKVEDIDSILNLYGLKESKSIEPLAQGISNSNYKVLTTNNEQVIIKVSNDKDIHELREEQEILISLKDFKYSLIPYKTRNEDLSYRYKGLHGVVFPFIAGTRPMVQDHTLLSIGSALAELHNFTLKNKAKFENTRKHSEVGFDFKSIESYTLQPESLTAYKEAFNMLITPDKRDFWRSADLPKGLIHGDLYPDNILFKENKLAVLLDFEQSGVAEYVLDLGICISGCCIDMHGFSRRQMDLVLEGYNEHRALNKDETELLNTAVILGLLDIALWRVKRFFEGALDSSKKDSYLELLEIAKDFKSKI